MIRNYVLGAALALCSTSAMAADLIIDTPEVAPVASAYDWSGFYAGVHIGAGSGPVTVLPLEPFDDSTATGWLVGGQLGYNAQFDSFVLGIEGDIAWSNINNQDDLDNGYEGEVNVNWLSTLRGRAGFAADSALFYVTAGLAVAGADYTDHDWDPNETLSGTHVGWAAGAGVEFAVTEEVSLKAEYLYVDLGKVTYDLGTPDDVSFNAHTFKAGVNFHF